MGRGQPVDLQREEDGYKQYKARQEYVGYQLLALVTVAISAVLVWLIEQFAPDFFSYPYFSWSVEWHDLARFWPAYLWGIAVTVLITEARSSSYDARLFGLGIVTSLLAGLWEELGYRFLFICFAMIMVFALNWLLSDGLIIFLAILAIGGILAVIFGLESLLSKIATVVVLAVVVWFLWLAMAANFDPVFWFYRNIFLTIANWMTLKQFEPIFFGAYPELFVFGAFLANIWFRDGHKYQGLFGFINSWYFGLVFLYASLTYGLLTAVAVHALYNMFIHATLFLKQKVVA